MAYNPLATGTTAVVTTLRNQPSAWGYTTDLDPREDGEYTTPGLAAVAWDVSVGNGRGSSKLTISGADSSDAAEVLAAFDPHAPDTAEADVSVAEAIRRTIAVEGDAPEEGKADERNVTFRTSLKRNARTVRIPIGEWGDFQALSAEVDGAMDRMVNYFREQRAAVEADADKRLAEGKAPKGKPGRKPKAK